MPLVSIVTCCLNGEDNVVELYRRIQAQFAGHDEYRFEHIFVDNGSTDGAAARAKDLAAADPRVKLIVNASNPGRAQDLGGMVSLAVTPLFPAKNLSARQRRRRSGSGARAGTSSAT
jgi:Glycosyl transferase family 2